MKTLGLIQRIGKDAEFEAKHPRDTNGEFSATGAGVASPKVIKEANRLASAWLGSAEQSIAQGYGAQKLTDIIAHDKSVSDSDRESLSREAVKVAMRDITGNYESYMGIRRHFGIGVDMRLTAYQNEVMSSKRGPVEPGSPVFTVNCPVATRDALESRGFIVRHGEPIIHQGTDVVSNPFDKAWHLRRFNQQEVRFVLGPSYRPIPEKEVESLKRQSARDAAKVRYYNSRDPGIERRAGDRWRERKMKTGSY